MKERKNQGDDGSTYGDGGNRRSSRLSVGVGSVWGIVRSLRTRIISHPRLP